MADLFAGGVTRGLIGASAYMKSAQTSASAFNQAKLKNDAAGMDRAGGHMSNFLNEAKNAVEKTNAALIESVQKVNEPEKTSGIDSARQQTIDNNRLAIEAANELIRSPLDTLEISPEARAAYQNEQLAAQAPQTEEAEEPSFIEQLIESASPDDETAVLTKDEEALASIHAEENENAAEAAQEIAQASEANEDMLPFTS